MKPLYLDGSGGEDLGRRLRCRGGRGTPSAVFVGEDAGRRRFGFGGSWEFNMIQPELNGHFRNLSFGYLPYIGPI